MDDGWVTVGRLLHMGIGLPELDRVLLFFGTIAIFWRALGSLRRFLSGGLGLEYSLCVG